MRKKKIIKAKYILTIGLFLFAYATNAQNNLLNYTEVMTLIMGVILCKIKMKTSFLLDYLQIHIVFIKLNKYGEVLVKNTYR